LTTYQSLKTSLIRKAALTKTPILGEFELTSRCNFSCPMCYVKELMPKNELSTAEWKSLFDEAVENGLLYALLTGGEPFIRPDFVELYEYLYDLGVKITVYTNGSLLNAALIQVFAKRPPEFIGLTLYGYDQASYEFMTKNKTGFQQFDEALDLLKEYKIQYALRTIPIQGIYQMLDQLIDYAKSKAAYLGYQLYVGPKRNSKEDNHQLRLNPTELLDFEVRLKTAFQASSSQSLNTDTTYSTCAALKSAYFMTWDGYMQPCALVSRPKKKVLPGSLKATFESLHDQMIQCDQSDECHHCEYYANCMQCYARRTLEGNVNGCSKYLKDVAILKKRLQDGDL
jgi:radical SAM protein with 4Fe4S-binding SPASM domain